MRLRHKKPMNSYVGQANLESSEVLDEDFDKHIPPGKKPKLPKQRPSSDNIRRYAQILVQFIQTINTDYNASIKKFPDKFKADNPPKSKSLLNGPLISKKVPEEQIIRRRPQVVSKQQQKGKLQQKNKILLEKQLRKTKVIKEEQIAKKEPSPAPQLPKPEIKLSNHLPTSKKNQIDLTLDDNDAPLQTKNLSHNNMASMNPMFYSGANYAPNTMNPAFLQSLQYQMPMYQQLLAQQIKQNPNIMMYMQPYQFQNLFAMMNMQNLQSSPQNYIPFSKLPFNQNKPQNKNKNFQSQRATKTSEIKDTGLIKSQITKTMGSGFFNKRSCIHVAIAYHIHCEKLKTSGKLSDSLNWKSSENKNLDELDPTYPAKKIRQRNHQQILHIPPDQQKSYQ